MRQTQGTPMFIHGKETTDLLGVPYSLSLFETVVMDTDPMTVVGFCQGHQFETSDKVNISPNLTKFTIHFKNRGLHEVVIFAETKEIATFLMDEMYNLDLVALLTQEITSIEPVWENAQV